MSKLDDFKVEELEQRLSAKAFCEEQTEHAANVRNL